MRKALIYLLIFSCIYQVWGCHTYRELSKEELKEQPGHIKIMMQDSTHYIFNDGFYFVDKDSLRGSGFRIVENNVNEKFTGSISLNDVIYSEVLGINWGYTFIVASGIILVWMLLSALTLMLGGSGSYIQN